MSIQSERLLLDLILIRSVKFEKYNYFLVDDEYLNVNVNEILISNSLISSQIENNKITELNNYFDNLVVEKIKSYIGTDVNNIIKIRKKNMIYSHGRADFKELIKYGFVKNKSFFYMLYYNDVWGIKKCKIGDTIRYFKNNL